MASDRFSQNTKSVVTVIVSLTAFATAATSLVKAVDKTLEQASYETLSAKIVELQDDNVRLHRTLEELVEANEEPSFKYVLPFASATPPATSAAPPLPTASSTHANIKAMHPCPPGDSLCGPKEPVAMPEPPPRPSLPLRAKPPSWTEVRKAADLK